MPRNGVGGINGDMDEEVVGKAIAFDGGEGSIAMSETTRTTPSIGSRFSGYTPHVITVSSDKGILRCCISFDYSS